MWPWDKIKDLEEENERLSRRIDHLENLELSETDKLELEFLRKAIKPYVVYSFKDMGYPGWRVEYAFYQERTLQHAESDLTKARFYIAVLEAQMGPDGVNAAKEVCERLKAVCSQKEVKAIKEA